MAEHAVLEARIGHLQADVTEIKQDIRRLATAIGARDMAVSATLDQRGTILNDQITSLVKLVMITTGIAGVGVGTAVVFALAMLTR